MNDRSRKITAALIVAGSFAAWTGLTSWSTAVPLLLSLTRNWSWVLLFAAAVTCVLRLSLLGLRPRFFLSPAVYFAGSVLVFQNTLIPRDASATFFFLFLFLHAACLFLLFALDPLLSAAKTFFQERDVKPWMPWAAAPFLLFIFQVMLQPGVPLQWASWMEAHYFALSLLTPWLSGLLRVRAGKPREYALGAAMAFVIGGAFRALGLIGDMHGFWSLRLPFLLLPLYLSAALHAGFEELRAFLSTGEIRRQADAVRARAQSAFAQFKTWLAAPRAPRAPEESPRRRALALLSHPRVKALGAGLAALLLLVLTVWGLRALYARYTVRLVEFSPEGEVVDRTVIRAVFSDDVSVEGPIHQADCFHIDPPLPGQYRQEAPNTIVYVPLEPLKPSTLYQVRFDPKNLRSKGKRFPFGASRSFHTPFFSVGDVKLMYQFDIFNDQEMEVTGEVNFNHAVDFQSLKEKLSLSKDGKPLAFELERSNRPDRFYFKISALKREDKVQTVTLDIRKGLACLGGDVPLADDFRRELELPSKPKLEVAEIKLLHEEGETLVSVLFNMPVSEDQARRNIVVEPSLPFSVETEYAYAVLRGDFKPNVQYKVTVRHGLIAKSGEVLEEDKEGGVYIQDLPPKVDFSHPGRVLSLNGPKVLEIKTMNLDKVSYSIQKVFRNNLLAFLNNEAYPPMARGLLSGTFRVTEGEINQTVAQHINLSALDAQPYKGLFTIELSDPREYYNKTRSWFLCTDLGLVAKHSGDDLLVYVHSIESLRSLPGVTLELMSEDNQLMDKLTTDDSGRAVFKSWRKHEYGLHPRFLVAKKDDDFSFLNFNGMQLNAYQFAVGGVSHSADGMEAFVATERGVYRPGEPAFVTAVVRNTDGSTPPDVPVRLFVIDPRGAEFLRLEGRYNANGLATFKVPFPAEALTGEYALSLRRVDRNNELGATTLKLEEFLPDKLRVEIDAPKGAVAPGQKLSFAVKARQLFGPPAAGNKAAAWVRFMARTFSHPAYKDYVFQDPLRTFEEDTLDLGEGKTDAEGRLAFEVEVPPVKAPSALKAYLYGEVHDSGGRPVSAAGSVDINPYARYLGLKLEENAPVRVKQSLHFRVAAISPDGKPLDAPGVRLVVRRRAWYSIFRRGAWGRSGYQSSSYEDMVLDRKIDVKNGKASFEFTPEAEGEYTVVLADPDGMRTGLTVQALGLGYETPALEAPEKLQLLLDKTSYAPGEDAKLIVRAPFAGKLYLTVEREKVLFTRVIDMDGHEAQVSIPVESSYLPNVYVVGMAVRRPDDKNRALPMVSFGVAPLEVKKDSKDIDLTWDLPAEVQSKDGVDVSLSVAGDPDASDVVLMAVDEGILQITGFKTPDPLGHFYRKRALDTQSYTMLDLLLPDIAEAKKFAIGGDEGGGFSRRHLNPVAAKKQLSYARFSGLLKPGPDGKVRYKFDTKNFTGEARIMALAVRGDRYGSSARPVRVADPIVLTANFPRFAAPKDQFQVPVEVFNKTGKDGEFVVTLKADGPVKVMEGSKTLKLAKETSKRAVFLVEAAADAGVAKFKVTAAGNGFDSLREEELSIRPATHLVTVVEQGSLAPGSSENVKVPSGLIPFGQRLRLSVSTNPLVRYLRSLDYVVGYPYGCSEQITSSVFPLLYAKELGYATGRFSEKANAVDLFVQEGIQELEKRQLSNGEFSLWPGGGSAGSYITLYASHMLLEARAQGYTVSPTAYARILGYLDRVTVAPASEYLEGGYHDDGGEGGEGEGVPLYDEPIDETGPRSQQVVDATEGRLDRRGQNVNLGQIDAYKVYLKALAGRPDREAMSVLFTQRLKTLGETERAWLSLSYSRLGDNASALKVLEPSFKSIFLHREQYGDFNSSIRNTAMHLYAVASADPQDKRVNEIVEYLGGQMKDGHFGTTQENVWVFMALSKVFGVRGEPSKTDLLADGQPYKTVEGRESTALDNALSGVKLTLKNAGDRKTYFHFIAEGTPLDKNTAASSKGLTIRRELRTPEGKEVNLSNVVQGDLLVVTLTVKPEKDEIRNAVLVDLLPGGLEVDNPRLRSRGQLGFDPPQGLSPAYQDIRDDRVLLFVDQIGGEQSFSYTVRAVTPGRFIVPNAFAEAMYDPEIRGESHEPKPLVIADNNGGK